MTEPNPKDPKDDRVNVRLDRRTATRFRQYAEAIGSDPSALARMLIRWHIGDAGAPPPRPAEKITTSEETPQP